MATGGSITVKIEVDGSKLEASLERLRKKYPWLFRLEEEAK